MRLIQRLTLSILLLGALSCKMETKIENNYFEKSITHQIDSLAHRYLELNRFSGVILVTKDDKVIYNHDFGLADYENKIPFSNTTAFKIGEISELITANIIRSIANSGKFQLSDKISKYIPEIKSELCINDLLNHSKDSTIESSDKSKVNDLDYNSLVLLIEKISGKSFQQNIEDYSKALGLENTYFQKTDATLAVGYLYHNYRGNGLELQKSPVPNSKDIFIKNDLKSSATDLSKIIRSNSKKQFEMDGYLENDGFSYSIMNDPKNKITIIVLSNRKHPVAKEISNSIAAILQDEDYRIPLARKLFDIDKNLLKDYSGFYTLNESMTIEVVNENDSLFVMMGPNKIHLIPQSENQFYMEQTDASMRFLTDTNQKVTDVVLLDGFLDGNKIKRTEK